MTEALLRSAAQRDGFPPYATAGAPDRIRAGRQREVPDPTLIMAWTERARTNVLGWQHSHANAMVPAEYGAWSAVEAALTSLHYAAAVLIQTQAVGKAVRDQAAARNAGQP